MSRPRIRHSTEGVFPRKEARRGDDYYTSDERDGIYNYLNLHGITDASFEGLAKVMERTFKSIRRQYQLIIYLEKNTLVFTYTPGPIRLPGKGMWTAMEKDVMEKHRERKVPIERTAVVLFRPFDQIRAYWELKKVREIEIKDTRGAHVSMGL